MSRESEELTFTTSSYFSDQLLDGATQTVERYKEDFKKIAESDEPLLFKEVRYDIEMMSREKQIEEMTKAIDRAKYDMWVGKAHQSGDFTNHSKNIATALYNADYRKQREWISVEDRLPDCEGKFLTIDDEGYIEVSSWYVKYGWFLLVCRANKITHWMPLPESPKKGGE